MAEERYLQMGPDTYQVSMELFALNRARLAEAIQEDKDLAGSSYILLQGGASLNLYNTDVEYVFRQESFFMWTFGVVEPGFYGAMNTETGETILFMPRETEDQEIWMGKPMTAEEVKDDYTVDEVFYVDQMHNVLREKTNDILILTGVNTDSQLAIDGAFFEGLEQFNINVTGLYPIMAELRVIKTDIELDVMRYVARVSSEAHKTIMLHIEVGMPEYQCESMFLDYCYRAGGCRHVAYTCICGSGKNSSILHYGHAAAPNGKTMVDGDMCLFDMGASYFGYSADITCSFPVNGKFTPDQKLIYEIVLEANKAVKDYAKPEENWLTLHLLAGRVLLQGLIDAGLLQGDVDDMLDAGLNSIFQPHGLGHLLGLDVHDVGGYTFDTPDKPVEANANKLRMARILKKGMVVTIEPGCYFIKPLLDKAMADPVLSKFLVVDEINRFRDFGGVRIEDDVIITEDGIEDMTQVPRTVQAIEEFMSTLKAMEGEIETETDDDLEAEMEPEVEAETEPEVEAEME